MESFYGNFSEAASASEIPAVTMSADPEHMVETVGHGFPVALTVSPNRTQNLDEIESETSTGVAAFSDVLEDVSGKNYFFQMSEKSLARKAAGERKRPDEVEERPYDFLAERFSREISDSLDDILMEYGRAIFFPYMNSEPVESFVENYDGLEMVAPDLELVEAWDSKTESYRKLGGGDVNLVPGETFQGLERAREFLDGKEWKSGAFVSRERGASGSGSAHVRSSDEIEQVYDEEGELLVQRWMDDVEAAPNVLLMIDDSSSTALVSSDQIIEGGTNYSGNSYPLGLDDGVIDSVEEQAEAVGEEMRLDGYRGIAGVDLMVVDGKPYYVEVNPRKNHSTVVKSAMLEETRPEEIPPLPEVEKGAVLDGEEYELEEWKDNMRRSNLSWDMYIFKEPGWIRSVDPVKSDFYDHEYDFESSFVANVPRSDVIIPRTYEGSKASGVTREPEEVELGRLVTTSEDQRISLLEDYREGFNFNGGGTS